MARRPHPPGESPERGAVAVLVAIALVALLGLAALALDVGHVATMKGELQNAADAGSLAGAAVLLQDDGTVNPGANAVAQQSVTVHATDTGGAGTPVAEYTIERGHFNFNAHEGLAAGTFSPNDSLDPTVLWNRSFDTLDADLNFINAVRVQTRRVDNPLRTWFARVFDQDSFPVRAEAVAYLGFAGTLEPGEADQPIAICDDQLVDENGNYTCSIGRMLNNGGNEGSHQTAMWTDYNQSESCSAASAVDVRPLICGEGNPGTLLLGKNIDSTDGVQESSFDRFRDCWLASTDTDGDGTPNISWELTLPVVRCENPCSALVGAVTLRIVWVVRDGHLVGSVRYDEAPLALDDWTCSTADCPEDPTDPGVRRQCCWGRFVAHFNLKNSDDATAPYDAKSIYFVPDCTPHIPAGHTGGENFGILAKYPALVH